MKKQPVLRKKLTLSGETVRRLRELSRSELPGITSAAPADSHQVITCPVTPFSIHTCLPWIC